MGKPAVLYISYDGMLEPLGQSQVIAYLEHLSGAHAIHLLSFEKPADRARTDQYAAVRQRLEQAGIAWHPLTYHKTPTVPATLFDIAQGTLAAVWLSARHQVRFVHARSYVAALIGWMVKLLTGAKLLFDMRGLWADERTDGGIWPPGGRVYRAVKRIERTLLGGADHIVTLTHASRAVIASFPYRIDAPVSVIPTCADLERFSPGKRGRVDPFTLGYLGSIGTWYLFDKVLDCFKLIRERRPDARLLVVNRNEQQLVRQMVAAAGIPSEALELTAADHSEVPAQVRRMTVGAAVIKPVFSKIASAPTKLAEYLGCGVPCLGNTGVGDMERILKGERVGVALESLDPAGLKAGVDRLLELVEDKALAGRCRKVASSLFSLDIGVAGYRKIYARLLDDNVNGWAEASPDLAAEGGWRG